MKIISFGECEKIVRHPLIIVEEKRAKLIFRNSNRSRVRHIRIDDCVITVGPRCDYLLINQQGIEHYVELKGSDVRRAFQQIEETIKQVGVNTQQRKAFIISTSCPMHGTEIQQKQKDFKKKYHTKLILMHTNDETDI